MTGPTAAAARGPRRLRRGTGYTSASTKPPGDVLRAQERGFDVKSISTAIWEGGLKDGKGTMTAAGGAFTNQPFSFAKRFEGAGPGTTPEELLAAAHAGCFAMATSAALGNAGFPPQRLEVKATVTMEPRDGKPTIIGSHLEMIARVPGIPAPKFDEIVGSTKEGCVISRALNTDITLDARLLG